MTYLLNMQSDKKITLKMLFSTQDSKPLTSSGGLLIRYLKKKRNHTIFRNVNLEIFSVVIRTFERRTCETSDNSDNNSHNFLLPGQIS